VLRWSCLVIAKDRLSELPPLGWPSDDRIKRIAAALREPSIRFQEHSYGGNEPPYLDNNVQKSLTFDQSMINFPSGEGVRFSDDFFFDSRTHQTREQDLFPQVPRSSLIRCLGWRLTYLPLVEQRF